SRFIITAERGNSRSPEEEGVFLWIVVMEEPTASGVFCGRMLSMVNSEDVNAIIQAQRHMLDRFEKTNEMLINFNGLSNVRLQQMNERFLLHTRTLVEMKKDLDSVFRRIRTLKGKVAKQYPEAFSSIHESPIPEDDDDEFDPVPHSLPTTITTPPRSRAQSHVTRVQM
ncbi:unnamed protein product, partial [Pleuronectes platessa]